MLEAAAEDEAALFDAPEVVVPDAVPDAAPGTPADAPPLPARGLDETVLAVLREEAEREAAARRAEAAAPIEMQPDLGLAAPAKAAAVDHAALSPVARRVARLKGIDPDPPPPPRPQTRREMLPAIEEINSTLRATSEKRTGEQEEAGGQVPVRSGGQGFRIGFVIMLVVAMAGLLAYLMAPGLGQQIPGAAPSLNAFVALVDTVRLWLDGVMQQAISALRGLSGDRPAWLGLAPARPA